MASQEKESEGSKKMEEDGRMKWKIEGLERLRKPTLLLHLAVASPVETAVPVRLICTHRGRRVLKRFYMKMTGGIRQLCSHRDCHV